MSDESSTPDETDDTSSVDSRDAFDAPDTPVTEPPSDHAPTPPIDSIPGGYQTITGVLGLVGLYFLYRSFDYGNPVRGFILILVAGGAWVLWQRLQLATKFAAAFSDERAKATTLLCAGLAGYGVAVESVLLGAIAATAILLASWVTSPNGPVLD